MDGTEDVAIFFYFVLGRVAFHQMHERSNFIANACKVWEVSGCIPTFCSNLAPMPELKYVQMIFSILATLGSLSHEADHGLLLSGVSSTFRAYCVWRAEAPL